MAKVLVLEEGFTPEGARGQTVFQVWHDEDAKVFTLREVPLDTIGVEQEFQGMHQAIDAMKTLMVERGFGPKGPKRAKHLPPRDPRSQARRVEGSDLVLSRFDRKEVV